MDGEPLPYYAKRHAGNYHFENKDSHRRGIDNAWTSCNQLGILLSGELTVLAKDKKTLHMKDGDSIVDVVNNAHYGKNEGTKTAEIIVFYAGIVDKAITVK